MNPAAKITHSSSVSVCILPAHVMQRARNRTQLFTSSGSMHVSPYWSGQPLTTWWQTTSPPAPGEGSQILSINSGPQRSTQSGHDPIDRNCILSENQSRRGWYPSKVLRVWDKLQHVSAACTHRITLSSVSTSWCTGH